MRILNRYILTQIAVPSLVAVLAIGLIAVATELQELFKEAPVAQVTFGDISRLMLLLLPVLVAYIIPITYMMGILLAFGRLSHQGELIAMRSAGIPLKRLVFPVILLGGILSIACFWVQDQVQPWALGKVYQLVTTELPMRVTLDALQPGIMHEFRGWRVYIGSKDTATHTLHDIAILKTDDDGRGAVVYHADSARLVTRAGQTRLEMPSGHLIPAAAGKTVSPVTFEGLVMPLPALNLGQREKRREEMTFRELYLWQKQTGQAYRQAPSILTARSLRRARQEAAERLSLPFACLAVSIVAAPLGARARRAGRSYTFAVGFGIVLVYYVLRLVVQPSGLQELSTVIIRTWIPNAVLCVAGLIFLWRVDRI